MIKLYDPNEKKETALRIDVGYREGEVFLDIVDTEGNYYESFACINEKGMEFYKIDPKYAPFKLTAKKYISHYYK